MRIPKLLRTAALGGALLAAVVACVRSAEAAPADYEYGAPGYAPTFGFDAAYYLRPPGYGGFRQFGGWYGQPNPYGGYYIYGGYYGYSGHRRWSRR